MRKENSGCSCSCSFIIICVVLIGFFLGPSKCSCARDVADKANEWRSFSDSLMMIRKAQPPVLSDSENTGRDLKGGEQ